MLHDSLLNHLPLLIVKTNEKGVITEVNDRYCQFSGFDREELVGGGFERMKCPVGIYATKLEELWAKIVGGGTWEGFFCNISKGGRTIWMKATVVRDGGGFCSMGFDVSTEKNNEYRLQRSQAFSSIGTWDWNMRNGELWWSEQIGPMFGHASGTLETSYENFLASVHPEDREGLQAAVNACLEGGAEYRYEHRCVWPDGTERWMSEMGDVLRGEDGKPFRMLGVVCDIHERKLAEIARLESEQAAQRANLAKGRFLGCMSHELRTPLNAILGFCELLLHEVNEAELRDPLLDIHRAAAHLLGIINDLLDVTSLEAAGAAARDPVERVAVDAVAADCAALVRLSAERRGIALRVRAAPHAAVLAHATHLRQVLVNLLQNAIKYSGGPVPEVELSCRVAADASRLRLCVADNGVGIAEEDLGRIFEVFTRLPQQQTQQRLPERGNSTEYIDGVGIGLFVAKLLVQRMGGSLHASSEIGKGSMFCVELPCLSPPAGGASPSLSALRSSSDDGLTRGLGLGQPGEDNQHLRTSSSPEMRVGAHFGEVANEKVRAALERPLRLLYVEDNRLNQKLMRRFIGRHCRRWTLTIAGDGAAGLELLRGTAAGDDGGGGAFDVVLLDLHLPGGISGFELLRIMRSGNSQSRFDGPVIAVSATRVKEHPDASAKECEDLRFDGEIIKPIMLSAFLSTIVQSIQKKDLFDDSTHCNE